MELQSRKRGGYHCKVKSETLNIDHRPQTFGNHPASASQVLIVSVHHHAQPALYVCVHLCVCMFVRVCVFTNVHEHVYVSIEPRGQSPVSSSSM